MHRLPRIVLPTVVALCALAHQSDAQGSANSSAPPLPATDSIFRRARRLVSEGDGTMGRALVDSLLRAAREGTPAYGDALFWRGALAETAADAERDYRRVIVEYPLSPYSDDALLSLAELEQARGDRAAAYQHLQRFVREHPASPARARAGLAAARLAFEQHDSRSGCAMISEARASTSDIELRNQIEYYGSHCATTAATASPAPAPAVTPSSTANVTPAGVSRGAPPPPATVTPTPRTTGSATSGTTKSQSAPPPPTSVEEPLSAVSVSRTEKAKPANTPPTRVQPSERASAPAKSAPRGRWTIQLAAYNTRADAERLVKKLAARDVKARISGDAKPFRVRLDYYATRQAAAAEVAALKQRGIIGFVTDEPSAKGAAHP
ncbi:MAG TPA: SPOR domain-containing protein [Gemmatimonadaceae bacterium]